MFFIDTIKPNAENNKKKKKNLFKTCFIFYESAEGMRIVMDRIK